MVKRELTFVIFAAQNEIAQQKWNRQLFTLFSRRSKKVFGIKLCNSRK